MLGDIMTLRTLLLCGLLAGCASPDTLHSTWVPPAEDTAPTETGVTYYLPRKLLTLDVRAMDPDTAALSEDLAKAKAATAEAEGQAKKAKDAIAAIDKDIAAMIAKCPGNSRSRCALADEEKIAAKETEAALEAIKQDKAEAAASGLGDKITALMIQFADASRADAGCLFNISLTTSKAMPDARYRFVAEFQGDAWRHDEFILKVGTNGLLSSADLTANDLTSEVITDLAGVAGAFRMSSMNYSGFVRDPWKEEVAKKKCHELPRVLATFDPADSNTFTALGEINDRLAPLRLRLDLAATAMVDFPSDPTEKVPPVANKSATAAGLFYRTPLPVIATISRIDRKPAEPIFANMIMLPQAGPISFIPAKSAPLVKTVDKVTFEDGSLTSWERNKPSEVVEVVKIPLKVLTAIVQVPAQLISFKVDYSTKNSALATQQAALIEQETRIRVMNACLQTAGADDEAALACLKD